jgi:2-methylisocitrate lyase-like PEP mutase family enzyme
MTDRIAAFRSLHVPGQPLVLPNVWDAGSAHIVVAAGAPVVATTSAGVSWSLGRPDGGGTSRDEALAHLNRIVRAVEVPVTADIESGFETTARDVADTITAVGAIGAVGVNIEDAAVDGDGPLRDVDEQCERLAAARKAAGDTLFINARVDTFLSGVGGLAETVVRASAYVAAGADGIFVPGVADPAVIAELVNTIAVPLNVMVGPGSPTVSALAGLGVARVSTGSALAQAAFALVRRAATEVLTDGSYATLADGDDFARLNSLMSMMAVTGTQ